MLTYFQEHNFSEWTSDLNENIIFIQENALENISKIVVILSQAEYVNSHFVTSGACLTKI